MARKGCIPTEKRTRRVALLADLLDERKRLTWKTIAKRFNIGRQATYRWLRRARAEYARRHAPIGAEARVLVGAAARAAIANSALKNGVADAA